MRGLVKGFVLIAGLAALALIHSCKKEEFGAFNLMSLVVGAQDIKIASPDTVAIGAVFTATFTANVDPVTLSAGSVTMTRDYDASAVLLTLTLTNRTLTITPSVALNSGTSYSIAITSILRSTNGLAFSGFSGSFKTIGTFVPSGEIAYWSFEGNPYDVIGSHNPATPDDQLVTFVPRTNAVSKQAAYFDGQTSIIQILGGTALLSPEFTITMWMYLDSDGHVDASNNQKGSYVFGIGNFHGLEFDVDPGYNWCRVSHGLQLSDGTTATSGFQFYGDGWTKDNIGSSPDSIKTGVENFTTFNQNIGMAGLKSKLDKTWAQIAFTYNDSTKTRSLYINGDLMYQQTFTLLDSMVVIPALRPLLKASGLVFVPDTAIPATYDDKLAFGFWQGKDASFGAPAIYSNLDANHFRGMLDDIRMFNRPLTDREVQLVYQDEKPMP